MTATLTARDSITDLLAAGRAVLHYTVTPQTRLPDDVAHQVWLSVDSTDPPGHRTIDTHGEAVIRWHFLDGHGFAARLEMYDDGWAAIAAVPGLWAALAAIAPEPTADDVVAAVERIGFTAAPGMTR